MEPARMKLQQFFKEVILKIRFNHFLLVIIYKQLYRTLAILQKFNLHLTFLQNTLLFLRSEWTTEEWF